MVLPDRPGVLKYAMLIVVSGIFAGIKIAVRPVNVAHGGGEQEDAKH